MNSEELTNKIVAIMEDRKAKDIQVIDTSKSTIITDRFIICNGTSTTHVRGIADEIMFKLRTEDDLVCHHTEGYDTAGWILIAYIDVVVHVFLKDQREFYNLERLWSDGIVERK